MRSAHDIVSKISTIKSQIPVTVMNVCIFSASILGILNAYNYFNITVMLVYYCNVMILFRLRELETAKYSTVLYK